MSNLSSSRCNPDTQSTQTGRVWAIFHTRPYRDLFFNPSGCGLPLYLYSMVWTRGVEQCRGRDFDDPKTGAMIGGHGYCTQELVNLRLGAWKDLEDEREGSTAVS